MHRAVQHQRRGRGVALNALARVVEHVRPEVGGDRVAADARTSAGRPVVIAEPLEADDRVVQETARIAGGAGQVGARDAVVEDLHRDVGPRAVDVAALDLDEAADRAGAGAFDAKLWSTGRRGDVAVILAGSEQFVNVVAV